LNEPGLTIDGEAAHWDHRDEDDHWEQPGILFRNMNEAERAALFANTARQIGGASRAVQERYLANCHRADPAYSDGVAKALGFG